MIGEKKQKPRSDRPAPSRCKDIQQQKENERSIKKGQHVSVRDQDAPVEKAGQREKAGPIASPEAPGAAHGLEENQVKGDSERHRDDLAVPQVPGVPRT